MDVALRSSGHAYLTSEVSFLAYRSGQARDARRTPIDNRCAGAVSQYVAGDLVLPGEPDILLSPRVDQEAVEGSHSACMAGDAIVQAQHHHAPSMRALFVKLIEFVTQRLLVSGCVPANEWKGDDVVQVEGIGDGHEISSAHRDDEWFVVARLIDVVKKAEFPQRLQNMDGVAHPIGVPADRLRTGNSVDRLNAVSDEAFLLIARQLIRIVPHPAMRGGLVTASYDFLGEVRRGFDRLSDHERAEFDPVLVHEVEGAGNSL